MSFSISAKAEILVKKRNVSPNLIVEIDGVTTLYSTLITLKQFLFDDGLYFDSSYFFDSGVPDPNIKDLISFGTTGNTISQQLLQDKGGSSSVSSFQIDLIDKDQEITKLVSPGVVLNDILGTKARVYLNFDGGIHPTDSILIHRGVIDEIRPQAASVVINIAHPESLKRQELFTKASTKLTSAIDSTQTTITVQSTANFILPTTNHIYSCIRIGDEIINYTGFTSTQFTGCTRGYLGTLSSSAASGSDVESFYRVKGNAIDLSLKLMLSQSDEYWVISDPKHIGAFDSLNSDDHVIFFEGFDGKKRFNYTVGDFVTITDSPFNNTTNSPITEIGTTDQGSYIKITATLVPELESLATVKFKSKYNVLTEGMGMTPDDVDVDGHEKIYTNYFSSLQEYDFYLSDSVNGKDFLSNQIYLASNLYTLPKNARAGVGITLPPVSNSDLAVLDSNNITNVSELKTVRSTNKNFYNSIVYRYNEDIDGKLKTGKITYSADSFNRIKSVGNKPLVIDANGLRETSGSLSIMDINSRRLIDRFRYGSELIEGVKVLFKDGFKIECGDVVLFGDADLNMTDISSGSRTFQQKAYEVVNKTINIKSAEVTLSLLSTGYDINGRYGLISPSTILDAGSTTTKLKLLPFMTSSISDERKKWESFIGKKLIVHNEDYSYYHETTILNLDNTDLWTMNVQALPTAPLVNYFISIPKYDESSSQAGYEYKIRYIYLNPTIAITSGTSHFIFNVSSGDVVKFKVGGIVLIRNNDWTVISLESKIIDITGNQITVETDLGFTPNNTNLIELIGFLDGGKPYRIL